MAARKRTTPGASPTEATSGRTNGTGKEGRITQLSIYADEQAATDPDQVADTRWIFKYDERGNLAERIEKGTYDGDEYYVDRIHEFSYACS